MKILIYCFALALLICIAFILIGRWQDDNAIVNHSEIKDRSVLK